MKQILLSVMVLPSLLGLAHCARPLPAVGLARGQAPVTGSPACAWRDVAGRCTVVTGAVRISCRALVRRDLDGGVRLVLLADEGLLLCDVAVNGDGLTVHREAPDLVGQGAGLGQLAWQVWGAPVADRAGFWQEGAWRVDDGVRRRWFAGDPLALRRVEGPGPLCEVGDYRPWGQGLMAHQAQLSGLGFTVRVQLGLPLPEAGTPDLNVPVMSE